MGKARWDQRNEDMHGTMEEEENERRRRVWRDVENVKKAVERGQVKVKNEDRWIFAVDSKEAMRKNDEYVEKWRETMQLCVDKGRDGSKQARLDKYWK